MKKRFWLRATIFILLLVVLEIVLRLFGFGCYPVYYQSNSYEYAFEPNQSLKRFGNTFYINSLGMRSADMDPNETKILGFGDSVLNGGVAISQEDLASSKLDSALQADISGTRFANISAGSWGVSNAYNWFLENNSHAPEAIVLVFSSHDYDDKMEFQNVVGNVSFYPDSQPLLAITDAITWVYSRYFENVNWSELQHYKTYADDEQPYDSGWDKFIEYSRSAHIPLIVYHHPDQSESRNGQWNSKGQQLEDLLSSRKIRTVSGLEVEMEEHDYRDEIHPSGSGQIKIAKAILPVLKLELKNE